MSLSVGEILKRKREEKGLTLVQVEKSLRIRQKFLSYVEKNEWDQAAVMKYLEIIAEATRQMSDTTKKLEEDIPWKEISNFRNVLIHEYFDVDIDLVWKVLQEDLPALRKAVNRLMTED